MSNPNKIDPVIAGINITAFLLFIAVALGVLYGLVRFVKWAWSD